MQDELNGNGLLLEARIQREDQRGALNRANGGREYDSERPIEEKRGDDALEKDQEMIREDGIAEDRPGQRVNPG